MILDKALLPAKPRAKGTNMQHSNEFERGHIRIGFVSTRFGGNDGVSLETRKWVEVLERHGHSCFFMAGECDWPAERSHVVELAHFEHPEVLSITQTGFSAQRRSRDLTSRIHQIKDLLKNELYAFTQRFEIDLLLVENALAIPMNLPLGVALTEFIAETGYPTVAHHHDFFWERKRFLANCVWDFLNMAFPPHLPTIHHVVINSSGSNQLSLRTGISSTLIPNVMDFANPPQPTDAYTKQLKGDMGVDEGEYFFLQPTRVVPRKGIEHAIELIRELGEPAHLVVSHASGDEGDDYEQRLKRFASMMGVPVSFVANRIQEHRGQLPDGRKIYTLWDVYPHADLVTYPSTIEGFGNAFLEAIYFRKPLLVNNYSIFAYDIKPKGFNVIEFDGYITPETTERVCEVLENTNLMDEMTEQNYQLARRYYSYEVLDRQLEALLSQAFGENAYEWWETNLGKDRTMDKLS
jgi:glycosyltransferase involved in cell wall biosynthesis